MAYVRQLALYVMDFDSRFPGLHITVRGITGDTLMELDDLDVTADQPLKAAELFMSLVDSWDLKRADGTSVPPTYAALLGYDMAFIRDVVGAWIRDVSMAPYPEQATPPITVTDSNEEEEGEEEQAAADLLQYMRYSTPYATVPA